MEKTAMQHLIDHIENMPWSEIKTKTHVELLTSVQNKAKELLKEEKQQMIEIFKDGFYKGCDQPLMDKVVEEYFNETFGGKIKP